MPHDVFISYSHINKPVADAICNTLEYNGLRCWYAPRDVGAGIWAEKIADAIDQCRVFVLVFSEHSNSSDQVLKEITLAVESECIIIPFRIDSTKMRGGIRYYLSDQHWLDAITPPLQEHISALCDTIRMQLGREAASEKPEKVEKAPPAEPKEEKQPAPQPAEPKKEDQPAPQPAPKPAEQPEQKKPIQDIGIIPSRHIIAAYDHTVAVKQDGTALAVGHNKHHQCDLQGWRDIVEVAVGNYHTVGLRADGTVITNKVEGFWTSFGQDKTDDWQDIVAVAAGYSHTLGLKRDGTVVAVGSDSYGQIGVKDLQEIVGISAFNYTTAALRRDGTVILRGERKIDVSGWPRVVAIAMGESHIVGLREDSTVIAAGDGSNGQCNVSAWNHIVAIAAGYRHTVGLCKDGTVIAAGSNNFKQCNVSEWKNIVAIAAGDYYTVGVTKDGEVLAVGDKAGGKCKVNGWKLWE